MKKNFLLQDLTFRALLLTTATFMTIAGFSPLPASQNEEQLPLLNRSSSSFNFVFENDALASDHYFTNGIHLEWIYNFHKREPLSEISTSDLTLINPTLRALFPLLDDGINNIYYGYRIGQEIYSPVNIRKRDVVPGDHPYSAYSYVSLFWGLNRAVRQSEIEERLSLSYGALGYNAAGAQAQRTVHDYIATSSPYPQGWEQLRHGESSLQLDYRYQKLYRAGSYVRLGYQSKLRLGNVATDISLGPIFKVGLFDNAPGALKRYQANFFIQPHVTLVGHNGHLQGGLLDRNKGSAQNYDFMDLVAFNMLVGPQDPLRTIFYYKNLIEKTTTVHVHNAMVRYSFLYRPLFNPNNAIPQGIDFALFNTIFNHSENPGFLGKVIVLDDLLVTNLTDPRERLLIIDMFLRQGESTPPLIRALAFQSFLQRTGRNLDSLTQLFIYRQLIEKVRPEKSYVVKKKNYHGTLSVGFAMDYNQFSLKITSTWRSSEFEHKEEFPDFHYYSTLEAIWRW